MHTQDQAGHGVTQVTAFGHVAPSAGRSGDRSHRICGNVTAAVVEADPRRSASSIRSNRLYLANRSERATEPILIWPDAVATERSAIVVSSVSPERAETTARKSFSRANFNACNVSVSVPT